MIKEMHLKKDSTLVLTIRPFPRMVVINNCIDQKFFTDISKIEFGEEKRPFRIIMVGNFCWQKDQMTLIDSIQKVKNHGYNVELHLVGGRNMRIFKLCQIEAKTKGLDDVVVFHGQKRVNSEFLSGFDLFAFSSKSETFGIATIEAMACGLPVLVFNIPTNMEIIRFGKDGFYFETGNSSSCADKIIKLITNPSMLEQMKGNGTNRIKEFNSETIIKKLEKNCYERIFKQNNLQL